MARDESKERKQSKVAKRKYESRDRKGVFASLLEEGSADVAQAVN